LSSEIITVFESMLQLLSVAFNAPSAENFTTLMRGLVLCLGRPTVRNLLRATDDEVTKHETAYHRFYSRAVWKIEKLYELLFKHVVIARFAGEGRLRVSGDDTTAGKTGRKVAYASMFRDAIASTSNRCVKHWSHNWVILCLIVPCPFAKERLLHIPLMARLYRTEKQCKGRVKFRTRHELLVEMVKSLRKWVGGRLIELSADGAYAAKEVIGSLPQSVVFTSRMRRDATLYRLAPRRKKGQRGRPRIKGKKLPKLETITKTAKFKSERALMYGERREVLIHTFIALWYHVSKKPVRVVIVRDKMGKQKDDYFFTTDVDRGAVEVVEEYAGRWGIEEAIRELKQSLGFDEVQSWTRKAVLRQAPLVVIAHAIVQAAYYGSERQDQITGSKTPSFARILTRLRTEMWKQRINAISGHKKDMHKLFDALEKAILTAA
jgi:hypothetical protein